MVVYRLALGFNQAAWLGAFFRNPEVGMVVRGQKESEI
jgi:hypothetical protein